MPDLGYILIADDEPDFLKATSALLRQLGYRCDCVPDASSAVAKLHENQYDLLVSDIEMPGNENLALIKTVPQIVEGLPVILISGHPTIETATQSFQFSVVAYLVKPVAPDSFINAVAQAIERFRAFSAVRQNRHRLQDSCNALERLESLMRASSVGTGSTPWNAFPSMTLQQIVESLQDLERYTEAIAQHKSGKHPQPEQDSPTPVALLSAVRETIAVLEKTKGAFKSKDLGELRRRLESLVD